MAVRSKTNARWTSSEIKKLYNYREEGMTFKQIGQKLGRSHMATMQKWHALKPVVVSKPAVKTETIKVNKQTLKSMELDVKGIKIHMVFS